MLGLLNNYDGIITVNGTEWGKNSPILTDGQDVHINIKPRCVKAVNGADKAGINVNVDDTVYKFTVKAYMTKKSTPEFDFMAKWNNDTPMPMRTMVGSIIKSTKGMVYAKLHGDITQEITCRCMKCGKTITNPVSRLFGMGPECGGHNYTHPFESDEALRQAVDSYRMQLREVTWEGWIIRSAIEEQKEV